MRNDGGKCGEEGEMEQGGRRDGREEGEMGAGGSRKVGDMNKEGRGRKDEVERKEGGAAWTSGHKLAQAGSEDCS